jgi:hypothetical protein
MDAGHREIRREAPEMRLGLIRAFAAVNNRVPSVRIPTPAQLARVTSMQAIDLRPLP